MTFLRFLAGLTWVDWVLIFAAWFLIACALGSFTGLGIRRADEAEAAARATYPPSPPPAPRITQAEVDSTWLDAWPTHVERSDIDQLEQRVYDRLFDDIVAIGGLES